MSKLVKSKRYKGVYTRLTKDGDISYYFTYKDEENKIHYKKVGNKSQGIDEHYTNQIRLETVTSVKLGDVPPKLVRNNKKIKVTVDDMSEFYFSNHFTKSSQKRQRQYNYRLKPFFGHMNIFNVNKKHLIEFREKTLKEVSEQTTNIHLELLSTLYNYYKTKNQVNLKNPVMEIGKVRVDNIRQRFLSKSEIDLLFQEIEHDFTMTLFLSLSLCTGGRKSTVMNYKIKDVDIEHKMINSYDFKNSTSYKSFLDNRTVELIKIRMKQSNSVNDSLVFKSEVHDLERWISRSFKIVLDNLFNLGLEENDRKNRVVIHTFRHTVLSHLGMNGSSEFLIKKISNHKSTRMVERYVKLDDNSGRNEINELWK